MIKAIETRYKGYRFRSRLEARWAVFFDALGLDWEYEPEGFDLGASGWYLPDFRVTSKQGYVAWYEVKASNSLDDGKMLKFEKGMEEDCCSEAVVFLVLCGDPFDFLGDNPAIKVCPRCGIIMRHSEGIENGADGAYYPCFPCDAGTPCGGDNEPDFGPLGIKCKPHKGCVDVNFNGYITHTRNVNDAATLARSARFEHGETP